MHSAPRFVLIGNPENRRVHFFQDALQRAGQAAALVIPWLDILNGECSPGDLPGGDVVVRIESPGENFEVEKRILALGGLENAMSLADERGRIYYPGLWFQGFSRLMESVAGYAGSRVTWFNHPADIVRMFNKPLCKQMLPAHTLPGLPIFSCYDEFFGFVQKQARSRFFIKLNSGSSASGVVAWEYHKKTGQQQAWSTVEHVPDPAGDRYYNSLKIKRYTGHGAIRNILDFLFGQGAMAEYWEPKARHGDQSYDLRVVAIAGRRRHAIARLSRHPMTNLHLGNARCPLDALGLSASTMAEMDALVVHTMQAFPRSLYAGLDVLLPRSGKAPILLEANAFGDLLPKLLDNAEDTYLAEIKAVLNRCQARPH